MAYINIINESLGIVPNASQHGPQVDFMLEFVHWFMLALFIGWTVFFFYTLIRFRKSRNPKADYVGVTSHKNTWIEGGVVIIEAVLLLVFAFPLWGQRVNQFPDDRDPGKVTKVRVIAEQFAWNFRYPGVDGEFGKQDPHFVSSDNPFGLDPDDAKGKDDFASSLNEMHVPVNKPVIIDISSKDVIHSYCVRQMRMTQDAIPGMSIPVWFTPIKTGKFEIACAQLCGIGHAKMRGFLVVETQEEYDKWLKDQAASGAAAGGGGGYD